MENNSLEITKLLELINKKEKMVAMLAPSFSIDFSYPEIIGMLKRLGFNYVVEVSRGAIETNKQVIELIKNKPDEKFITSPCPSIVRLIRNKYPEFKDFLTLTDSPMIATAKIVKEKYPDYKKVFIGPCFVKKLEAKEDYPELDIIVLTYKELIKIFRIKNINPTEQDKNHKFDIKGFETRLYPISGGLTQSSNINNSLLDEQYDVISGPKLAEKTIQEFKNNPDLKLLDILFCEGGCINGGGINSEDSLDEKRKRIINYWNNNK